MSPVSAGLARKAGYNDVSVYHEGVFHWIADGKLTHSTVENILSNNVAIIDLRERAVVKSNGRIPGSVSIPISEFEDFIDDFPKCKDAPIVLYGDDPKAVTRAFEMLREELYSNITLLPDWKNQWISHDRSLLFDPAILTEINWTRPYAENGLLLSKVEDIRKKNDIVVDVREAKEFQEQQLPGAINVPLAEVYTKIPKLVKEASRNSAFVYLYCNSGIRARAAYESLVQEEGVLTDYRNLRFINDNVFGGYY
jgi:rhodanese-related sulfurtransferase